MSRTVQEARVEVYRPTNESDSPNFEIPDSDVDSVNAGLKLSEQVDEGTIVLHNHDGTYSGGERALYVGDRLDFYVSLASDTYAWADKRTPPWGPGMGGWGGELLRWSARVLDPKFVRGGPTESYLELKCEDFVSGVMNDRVVYNAFESAPIAGSEDAILNTVLRQECPEIDRSRLDSVGTTTSVAADGTSVLDLALELARRANAVMYPRRDRLVFKPVAEISPTWTLDPVADMGTFSHGFDGGSVSNVVRVDGGSNHAIDDEQPVVDDNWGVTVTEASRATFQVSTRKSQLDRIELWTRPNYTGSEESLNVRVQKDDGGAPIAPGDSDSDIDSKQLSHEFLAGNDWTSFLLNDHTLPEPNPWILVETDGSEGQRLGVKHNSNSADEVAYKAHYPYEVAIQVRDGNSMKRHGRREKRVKKDNIVTTEGAKDRAEAHLAHDATPESEFSAPALSRRAHGLIPGEVFHAEEPRERLVGDFIVTGRTDTYDGAKLSSDLHAAEVSSI